MRSTLSTMRRTPHERLATYGLAVAVLLLLLSGILDRRDAPLQVLIPLMGVLFGWLAWEMYRGIVRFWAVDRSLEPSYDPWLGLGFAVLAALAILLRMSGGLFSPFYPILYLAIAFLASFGTSSQGAVWFGYALLLELTSVIASGSFQQGAVGRGALHLFFLSLFAGSHHVYLHTMLHSLRQHRNTKLSMPAQDEANAPHDASAAPPGMTMVSLEALDDDRQALLSLLKEGLDAHGCAFLWLNPDGQHYEVSAIETEAPEFGPGPFSSRTGAPAGLFKGQSRVRLSRAGDIGIHLPYYSRNVQVRALLAIPVRQGQQVRGALCADRIHLAPFSAREEALLEAAAMVFGRALESERSFRRSDRDLQSLNMLHQAGQILNQAQNQSSLANQALEVVSQFAPFEWGFISEYHEEQQSHTLLATAGLPEELNGHTLPLGNCLLSLAFKHQCPLPENGQLRSPGPYFSADEPDPFPSMASLYALPLILKDRPIGSLVLASNDPLCFADHERQKNLGTLTNQIAALLENARYTQKLQQLAQHDGLTNLTNHRTFMEHLHQNFLSAKRYQKNLSMLLIDIDHFKQVNDTYGHPLGDRVLRQIAYVLKESAREIDIVARYGGEEFAILLPETPSMGALKLADRLRKQAAQLTFCSDDDDPETFRVTISIGVANFPSHASAPDTLLRHADEALYAAKHRGRNRVVLYHSSEEGSTTFSSSSADLPASPPAKGWGWGSLPPEAQESLSDPERWSFAPPQTPQRISSNPPNEASPPPAGEPPQDPKDHTSPSLPPLHDIS